LSLNSIVISVTAIIISNYFLVNCENSDDGVFQSEKLKFVEYKENSNTKIVFTKNGLTLNFKSVLDENKILTEVKITDNILKNDLHATVFTIDKNIPSYKLGLFNKIENISNQLMDGLDANNWLRVRNLYESFLKNISKIVGANKYKSELIQSAFYHLSIYNTITRSLENNERCECTPLPDYFVDKSSFWCQEDYFFEIEELLDYYSQNKKLLFSIEGGKKEYDYLNNMDDNKNFVSYKELFKLHYSVENYKKTAHAKFELAKKNIGQLKKDVDRDDCWSGGLGSDLGCCGNYEGCCWFASLACLRHDIACLKCDKWHCGPACKPEK